MAKKNVENNIIQNVHNEIVQMHEKKFLEQLSMILNHYGWSTLQGGQKCCHIVLFSRGVHVWTSTMVILEHIFPTVLHNMVDYNTKNSIAKKFSFSNLYCAILKYICGKKYTWLCAKKCKYTQKMIEMIFSLYEICSIY